MIIYFKTSEQNTIVKKIINDQFRDKIQLGTNKSRNLNHFVLFSPSLILRAQMFAGKRVIFRIVISSVVLSCSADVIPFVLCYQHSSLLHYVDYNCTYYIKLNHCYHTSDLYRYGPVYCSFNNSVKFIRIFIKFTE